MVRECGTGRKRFDSRLSSSYATVSSNLQWDEYGSGNITYFVGRDDFFVGNGLSVAGAVFGQAVDETPRATFDSFVADGILGLAFADLAKIRDPGTGKPYWPLGELLSQNFDQSDWKFSVYMADAQSVIPSQILFGGYEPALLGPNNTMLYTDVVPLTIAGTTGYQYWITSLARSQVGGTTLCGDCYAIVDTGTSLLTIPSQLWNQFTDALVRGASEEVRIVEDQGSVLKLTACGDGSVACYPPFEFEFPDSDDSSRVHVFSLPPEAYLLVTGDGKVQAMVDHSRSMLTNAATFILGDVFLRRVYTVFDHSGDVARVGMAGALSRPAPDTDDDSDSQQVLIAVAVGGACLCGMMLITWLMVEKCSGPSRRRGQQFQQPLLPVEAMEPQIYSPPAISVAAPTPDAVGDTNAGAATTPIAAAGEESAADVE